MERPWHAFYDQDVPRIIAYPKVTLKELFNRNAKNNSDKPNLILDPRSREFSQCSGNWTKRSIVGNRTRIRYAEMERN